MPKYWHLNSSPISSLLHKGHILFSLAMFFRLPFSTGNLWFVVLNYPYHLKNLSSFRKPNYLYIFCNSMPSENHLLKKATFEILISEILFNRVFQPQFINKSLRLPNIIKTTITQYMFYIFQPHKVSISHSQHIIHTVVHL